MAGGLSRSIAFVQANSLPTCIANNHLWHLGLGCRDIWVFAFRAGIVNEWSASWAALGELGDGVLEGGHGGSELRLWRRAGERILKPKLDQFYDLIFGDVVFGGQRKRSKEEMYTNTNDLGPAWETVVGAAGAVTRYKRMANGKSCAVR